VVVQYQEHKPAKVKMDRAMNKQHFRTQIDEQRFIAAQPAIDVASKQSAEECIVILAHDLRNYITSIHGNLTLLYAQARREQRELPLATSAQKVLEQMDRLIANVLDTVRMERGFFELMLQPLDLAILAQQCAELSQTDAHPIELHLPPTACIRADEDRLCQAIHNLLANAIEHSPSQAPITLSLETETRADGIWFVLSVRDRGAGIPPEMLSQIFERFTAGPRSTGLGLGLYLVRGIALAHGGTLSVRSTVGRGTCFELALPSAMCITL
jgi:two-component system OmpR family sensor kinase